jgi:hypothetical protein
MTSQRKIVEISKKQNISEIAFFLSRGRLRATKKTCKSFVEQMCTSLLANMTKSKNVGESAIKKTWAHSELLPPTTTQDILQTKFR